MIILTLAFTTIITKTKIELSITATIISFGISYGYYIVTIIVMSAILALTKSKPTQIVLITSSAIQCLLQLFLSTIPFKFKRLKKGMPFLVNEGSSDVGVLISVVLLCAVIIFSNNKDTMIYVIPFILIILFTVLILFWWRRQITQTYINMLKSEEMKNLQNTITEKDERLHYLEQQNEILSKIIHKDNKMIPSMELAVREYLRTSTQAENNEVKITGEKLLNELSVISKERFGILEKYQNQNKKLPLTDVFSIDSLFNYMLSKSGKHNIEFNLSLSGSIKFMAENIISEAELNTLLADLIENAIIATKDTAIKKIIVNVGIADGCYFIDIIDSGMPFEIEVLKNLGIKKHTTHAHEGGSGIGLFNTFELVKKANASFIIKEFECDDNLQFTKKISIKFNGNCQYIIESYRNEEIKKICQRTDVCFINDINEVLA